MDQFSFSDRDRFWNMVDSRQAGECWIWDGALSSSDGYGKFHHCNTSYYAHRVVWEMYRGQIPDSMLVLHKCDTKRCVNPDHLYVGTYSDNSKDRYDRFPDSGRGRNYSKLTEEEAMIIKLLSAEGRNYTQISKLFDVTDKTISNVCRGKTTLFRKEI